MMIHTKKATPAAGQSFPPFFLFFFYLRACVVHRPLVFFFPRLFIFVPIRPGGPPLCATKSAPSPASSSGLCGCCRFLRGFFFPSLSLDLFYSLNAFNAAQPYARLAAWRTDDIARVHIWVFV